MNNVFIEKYVTFMKTIWLLLLCSFPLLAMGQTESVIGSTKFPKIVNVEIKDKTFNDENKEFYDLSLQVKSINTSFIIVSVEEEHSPYITSYTSENPDSITSFLCQSISVYGWAKIEIVAGNSFGKDYYILEIPDSSQTSDIGILRPNDITEIKVYDVSGKQLCSAKSMDEINRFGNQMLILRLYSHGRLVGTRKVKN